MNNMHVIIKIYNYSWWKLRDYMFLMKCTLSMCKAIKWEKSYRIGKFNIYDNTHKSIRERKAELIIIQYPEGEW